MDFGIIELDTPFEMEYDGRHYKVNTICLPQTQTDEDIDWRRRENATVFGFGRTGPECSEGSTEMRKLELIAYNCKKIDWICIDLIHSNHVCTVSLKYI